MDKFKVAKETMSGCRRSFWRTYRSTTVGLLCVAAAIGVAGCDQASHTTEQEKKAIEVIVTTPITDEVTDYQDFTGRLDALKTVDIRARVSGFVMTAPFKEGDVVHAQVQLEDQSYAASVLCIPQGQSKLVRMVIALRTTSPLEPKSGVGRSP